MTVHNESGGTSGTSGTQRPQSASTHIQSDDIPDHSDDDQADQPTERTARRTLRNRLAQRAHRARKEQKIKSLEQQVSELLELCNQQQQQIEKLSSASTSAPSSCANCSAKDKRIEELTTLVSSQTQKQFQTNQQISPVTASPPVMDPMLGFHSVSTMSNSQFASSSSQPFRIQPQIAMFQQQQQQLPQHQQRISHQPLSFGLTSQQQPQPILNSHSLLIPPTINPIASINQNQSMQHQQQQQQYSIMYNGFRRASQPNVFPRKDSK
ncbi:hypothetical protein BCR33DRAFT_718717 [Rhizoclosmatium globosum]|uniref:BZIP domain-containing protein n=1 Tax=Rhizoclosmatium globosum TaxID=329046 RepID=A0A1Y2C3T8_9FUNG|nr:hypothetical protein BCR33DRAFT_718717 [Rhizoclosmatium globosum]|eukprot:ORY41554.1 hypothetical protein BCR33DRAFT_718717 [Rhizoclosmatium globosum]